MKKFALITIITFFAVSLLSNNAEAKDNKKEKTTTFIVSIDCHGCVKKIEDNISYEKGVKDLKVSLDEKECTVTFKTDKTNEQKLIKAFNKLGYTAEIKKENKGEHEHHDHDQHDGHNH